MKRVPRLPCHSPDERFAGLADRKDGDCPSYGKFPMVVLDVTRHIPIPYQCDEATKGKNMMANQQHLNKLREGVDTWNQWRADHPEITPDLSGAELTSAQLQRADLTSTNLRD